MAGQESKCEEVREQLVGQGYSALRIDLMGCKHSPQSPTGGGWLAPMASVGLNALISLIY